MKDYIKKIIQQQGLTFALIFIMIIIGFNAGLVIYYRNVMVKNAELKQQIQEVKNGLTTLESHIWLGDLGVRAYLIKPTIEFLSPYLGVRDSFNDNLTALEDNLQVIGYDLIIMQPAKVAISNYMEDLQLMVDLVDIQKQDEALDIFYEDRGYTAWRQYEPFLESANTFISDLNLQNYQEYDSSILSLLIFQIILISITIPILIVVISKLKKDKIFKTQIFDLIDKSNRNYLFNDGESHEDRSEDNITSSMIVNLKKATDFINNISQGNYDKTWEGMDKKTEELNKNNIAGELNMMRDQMRKAKKEDDIRIWTNEGLSNFGDLIRRNQDDIDKLSDELISNIVQYLEAQQGGLFFLEEDDNKDQYLQLMGCYAYQRKKFLKKRVEIGQGMVGQCFLEGETTYITNVPEEYINITSGLGNTNPTTLLIVPLRVNEEVVGVIEVASLKPIEKYQIEFLERLAETIASSIAAVKTNESTRILLEQSQQQAEEMRAQEEEMRQNMEELQATQEQMHRKNEEIENLLRQASENEESMKMSLEALEELQEEGARKNKFMMEEKSKLELEDAILSTIMDISSDRITVKDKSGTYLKLSKSKLQGLLDKGFDNVIGQSDREIFGEEHFAKTFEVEEKIMTSQKPVFDIVEQIKLSEKVKIWGLTSRAPLKGKNGEILGTVVITRDITKEKDCEEKLKK